MPDKIDSDTGERLQLKQNTRGVWPSNKRVHRKQQHIQVLVEKK